jgi:PAS domain S-box-containing protein
MASGSYPYIDISALDGVRQRFAAGDALAILSVDLEEVIWANGPGASLLGFADIASVVGAPPGLGLPARRQVMATPGYPEIGSDRALLVRLSQGMSSRAQPLLVSKVVLPDGEPAILLAALVNGGVPAAPDAAERAIAGLDGHGQFAAMVDGDGKVLASSSGFSKLGIAGETLTQLIAEARQDRLVKRMIEARPIQLPAGLVRLTDDPAVHLLVVIDEGEPEPMVSDDDAPTTDEVGDAPQAENGDRWYFHGDSDAGIAAMIGDAPVSDEVAEAEETQHIPSDEPSASEPVAELPPPADEVQPENPAQNEHVAETELEPEPAETPVTALEVPAETPAAPQPLARDADRRFPPADRSAGPVRFVWRTDAAGRFSAVSPEFAAVVGPEAADIIGRAFSDVAERLDIDPDGEIAGLLERRDTWSGRSVLWPVAGTDLRVPVDLAALPAYGRDRAFEGFRGFGVARGGDVVVDPDAVGMRLVEATEAAPAEPLVVEPEPPVADDPFRGEVRALSIESGPDRRYTDKVVRLAERPDPEPANDRGLTPGERTAFREIGNRLKTETSAPLPEASDADAELAVFEEAAREARTEEPETGETQATDGATPDGVIVASEQAAQGGDEQPAVGEDTDLSKLRSGVVGEDMSAVRAALEELVGESDVGAEPPRESAADWTAEAQPSEPVAELEADEPDTVPASAIDDGLGDIEERRDPETLEWPPFDDAETASPEHEAVTDPAMLASLGTEGEPAPLDNVARPEGYPAEVAPPEERPAEAEPTDEPWASQTGEGQSADTEERVAPSLLNLAPSEDTPAEPEAVAEVESAPTTLPEAEAETSTEAASADEAHPVAGPEPEADTRPDLSAYPATETSAHLHTPSALAGSDPGKRAPVDTTILEQLPVPVLIHAGDDLYFANREFLDLTGYDSLEDLEDAGGLGGLFGEPYQDGVDGAPDRRLRLRTSEGLEFPVEALLQSVPWNGGKALLLSLRRVGRAAIPIRTPHTPAAAARAAQAAETAAAIAENSELQARLAEMRAIIDTATDGVVLIAPDGAIRSISRAAEALFGLDSADVAGKHFASLFAVESQRAARDYLAGLSENGVASVLNDGREVIGREAQGRFIPLFMTMGRLPDDSGYCAVMRDITQWKRAEEDLTQARAQAERASSQKTDFLARVSHEIRTPLNAIIGFSELMIDEKFGPIGNDRYRDYLRDINRSGSHVLDLVNDLLDISKIEAGQQEMEYEAVSLNDTLAETVAMMQPQANRERVIIRSSFASRLPEVVADLRSVRQIALNLLSNAIRYTQAGGQVIVSTAYEAAGDVALRVRDTGIGMSHAEIEQALKPFKQVSALRRGRGDGTGLGLPLTKAMVEANRARFSITSTPGEGTLVEIVFPSTRVLAD